MIRRPPRSTQSRTSAASDVYKRQVHTGPDEQHCHQQPRLYDVNWDRKVPENPVVHELQHDRYDQTEAEQQERLLEIGVVTPEVPQRVPLRKARDIKRRQAERDKEQDAHDEDQRQAMGLHGVSLLQKACFDVESALGGTRHVVMTAYACWGQVKDGARVADRK